MAVLRNGSGGTALMIAVDWGSSSLRAFRLDDHGQIVDRRHAALGVFTHRGDFESPLRRQIDGWDDSLIVLAGMIGSRQGWMEVPYVPCPATLEQVAAGMRPLDTSSFPGRSIWIVPGLAYRPFEQDRNGDVLRGEETQIFGLPEPVLTARKAWRQIVCLPGTHSKWVALENGQVASFLTAMTGELFGLLCQYSSLGRLMPEQPAKTDWPAFDRGIERARESGGLSHHLFSVRSSSLLDSLQPDQLASYLSGLLIGHEIVDLPWIAELRGFSVHLIGNPAILDSYSGALQTFGIVVARHGEDSCATGAYRLAKQRGLS